MNNDNKNTTKVGATRIHPVLTLIISLFTARQPPVGHGLLIYGVFRSHTTTQNSRYDSSLRVISSSQRPLPDNTQHSQQTNIRAPRWEPTTSAGEPSQTYALDRAAARTGTTSMCSTATAILILMQLVMVLCFNPVCLGFDSKWRHWNFSLS